MPFNEPDEYVEDLRERCDKVFALLVQGVSLEEAVQAAFCLEREQAREYVGRFFAEMYAEMMGYGREK